ncbi:Calycin-like [Ostreococcus tauri]|uniref:Calycin-like n=1 Tax=Ostreococcus tauri TaxID=70448 RepID=Q01G38_OSTTA|nr:Calycin-like [Ostreococcus tauri]CAL50306.1 Calycin-like [Ostreococcus tauri]|eukprot:XP_003074455.1 Calycin-like [Ostreococcus tauri]
MINVDALAAWLDLARCPRALEGAWTEDRADPRRRSLCPLVTALGVPRIVCPLIDAVKTDVFITCDDDGGGMTVIDRTNVSGANVTAVRFDGTERERTTRGGRKSFMLSGDARASAGSATVRCRLHRRGDGWETLQVREIVDGKLRERNVLKRPGMEDVVVDRYFKRKE